MSLLTDQELKDAVRKLFITPEAHSMAMLSSIEEYRLIEAAVIAKLEGVGLEPVAWARRDDEGQEFDMVFLDKAECQSYLDDDESPEGLQTASQLAAARKCDSALLRQALVALQSLRYRSIGPDVPDEAIAAIEKRLGQL